MAKQGIQVNLNGIKIHAWRKDLTGLFIIDGRELSDKEARRIIRWGINKGYTYDSDIPDSEAKKVLGWS